uniref:Zinc finger CCHC domain-containing protein 7 n=1 Tax=Romanomermis culicivorax TaxID=13658 RepID=A0A915K4W7_ROMCU
MEIQDDNDEIDPELEEKLYSLVYHQSINDTVDLNHGGKVDTKFNSHFDYEENNSDSAVVVCDSEKSDSTSNLNETFDDYHSVQSVTQDSGCSSVELCSVASTSSSSLNYERFLPKDTNISGNFDTSKIVGWLNDKNITLTENALEMLSVREIQASLPDDPDLWKVCDEDLLACEISMISRGRYYAKRSRCKRCNEEGHSVASCTKKPQRVCVLCGESTHWLSKCQQKPCILCMKFGHFTEHCGKTLSDILKKRCRRCQSNGHTDMECPEIWRQFRATVASENDFVRLTKIVYQDGIKKSCFNCGGRGHLGHECELKTNYNNRVIPLHPRVLCYDSKQRLVSMEKKATRKANMALRKNYSNNNKHFRFPDNESFFANEIPTPVKTKKLSKKQQRKLQQQKPKRKGKIERQAEKAKELLDISQSNFRELIKQNSMKKPKTKKVLSACNSKKKKKITMKLASNLNGIPKKQKKNTKSVAHSQNPAIDHSSTPKNKKRKLKTKNSGVQPMMCKKRRKMIVDSSKVIVIKDRANQNLDWNDVRSKLSCSKSKQFSWDQDVDVPEMIRRDSWF